MELNELLESKNVIHGDYLTHCRNIAEIRYDHYCNLSEVVKLVTLDYIALKLVRIKIGDPKHLDHYVDILGYCTIAIKAIDKLNRNDQGKQYDNIITNFINNYVDERVFQSVGPARNNLSLKDYIESLTYIVTHGKSQNEESLPLLFSAIYSATERILQRVKDCPVMIEQDIKEYKNSQNPNYVGEDEPKITRDEPLIVTDNNTQIAELKVKTRAPRKSKTVFGHTVFPESKIESQINEAIDVANDLIHDSKINEVLLKANREIIHDFKINEALLKANSEIIHDSKINEALLKANREIFTPQIQHTIAYEKLIDETYIQPANKLALELVKELASGIVTTKELRELCSTKMKNNVPFATIKEIISESGKPNLESLSSEEVLTAFNKIKGL